MQHAALLREVSQHKQQFMSLCYDFQASRFRYARLLAEFQASGVIVDLSRLGYLDCAGIHVLEDAARANGACFVVVGSKPQVRRMFEVLKLTDVLPVLFSLAAAREYLRNQ